ncbi:toll/interleukin-1 receptor domain-containing protein [Nocardia sp. NPDC049220]|uniref:toll/interleukin-1 receptor domain-containing protein n=1 Tax=Nocardia sp. NPDC049220 TaxID=3155273 RepID=UPI0033D9E083
MSLMPSGFWSYARSDDEATDGQVVRLAHRLMKEFRLLSGTNLEIFIDRDSIAWGEAWADRIDDSIHGTTFFIPLITPSYLSSNSCRSEFLKFWGKSNYAQLQQLVLPIIFSGIDLDSDTDDDVLSIAIARQAEDWSELRLEDENSSKYRKGVNRLAKRLQTIAETIAAQPEISSTRTLPEISDRDTERDNDDEPGFLERIVQIEEELPLWESTTKSIGKAMEDIQIAMIESEPNIERAKKSGAVAARIRAIGKLANSLDQPTLDFQEHAENFRNHAVALDPAFKALIQLAEVSDVNDRRSAAALADTIDAFRQGLAEAMTTDQTFRNSLEMAAKISRDMKKPTRKILAAMRSINDAESILGDWADGLRNARVSATDLNPTS